MNIQDFEVSTKAPFNEMLGDDGVVRSAYRQVAGWLDGQSRADLKRKQQEAESLFRQVTGGAASWREDYLQPTPSAAIVVRMLNNLRAAFTRDSPDFFVHSPYVAK